MLKTNILSKCIHLLSSIERSETFLKSTNKLIFNFLWDGKPDKIKRSIMVSDYMSGGMKMVDIYNFERALKVNWIKKLLSQKKSLWNQMFKQIYKSCDKVIQFGDQWCVKMLPTIKNPFWKDVVTDWALLVKNNKSPQIQIFFTHAFGITLKYTKVMFFCQVGLTKEFI